MRGTILFTYFSFLVAFLFYIYRDRLLKKPMGFSLELPSKRPPAVVGMLTNPFNRVTTKEMLATLVDLYYRKNISMRVRGPKKDRLEIELLNEKGMEYFEKRLMAMLLGEKSKVVLEERLKPLKKSGKLRALFIKDMDAWAGLVHGKAEKMVTWTSPKVIFTPLLYGATLAIVMYVGTFLLFPYPFIDFLIDMLFAAILQVCLMWLYSLAFDGLTPRARKERDAWLTLRNTLEKYTAIKDKHPDAHVVWDRIMPYAVALGVSHEVYRIAGELIELPALHQYSKTEQLLNPMELGKGFVKMVLEG